MARQDLDPQSQPLRLNARDLWVTIWRFYKDTGSPEKGYDWLRRLDANVHEYTADGTLLMQKLARREGLISLWNMPDVWAYKQKGLPVAYVIPASGTP